MMFFNDQNEYAKCPKKNRRKNKLKHFHALINHKKRAFIIYQLCIELMLVC
jgi:hypothetical protein